MPNTRLSYENADFKNWWMNCHHRHGGYEPDSQTMTPLHGVSDLLPEDDTSNAESGMQFILDSIAGAYEAGTYQTFEQFVERCFATEGEFRAFAENTSVYEMYWMNERHYAAFYEFKGEDYGIRTYEELGETLLELVE
ncbi:MAG: hypothetical protein KGL42_16170 [Betaproteobacteria bacterium]|nr:hypothetical protein [Betaproteobacteria bacterium]